MSKERDQFEIWLIHMDDALSEFGVNSGIEGLDYSRASLAKVERLILSNFDTVRAVSDSEEKKTLVDGAARYLGEVFRKTFSGKWDIELESKTDVYFGLPVVRRFACPKLLTVCPLSLVTASADRRSGNFWQTIFDNYKKRELTGEKQA